MYILKQIPMAQGIAKSSISYPAPSNLTYYWNFGFLGIIFLYNIKLFRDYFQQCINVHLLYFAFNSVEHIMRDVLLWLVFIDICMPNGASFFFIVVYLHYVSCLYYDHILYMLTLCVMGYGRYYLFYDDLLLRFQLWYYPGVKCSYWGATVIYNLSQQFWYRGKACNIIMGGIFCISNCIKIDFLFSHFFLPFVLVSFCIITYITITCSITQVYHYVLILMQYQISFYLIIYIRFNSGF